MLQLKLKSYHILSLFDGMGCGYQSAKESNLNVASYTASEIEAVPVMIATKNHPQIIHVGDVRKIKGKDYKHVDIIIGGSPCQQLSGAGKKTGLSDENSQSYLFYEFVRILKEVRQYNPNVKFILENVKMSKKWENIISNELGVKPIKINSSLLTAQNRERLYWTNIEGVTLPKDKHIHLNNVIPGATGYTKNGYNLGKKKPNGEILWEQITKKNENNKAYCVTTKKGNTNKLIFPDGTIRHYTINEAEMLQGLPKDYTKVPGLSETARYKAVGNGWTIPVIAHILSFLKK